MGAERRYTFSRRSVVSSTRRDIEACLSAPEAKLYHMGFREPIGFYTKQDYPEHLRRIRFKDAESSNVLVFLTNQ